MTEPTYNVDDYAKITARFLVDGVLTDPASLMVEVRRLTPTPAGTATTFIYGTDAEVVKVSTGIYSCVVSCSEAGRWAVHFASTGAAAGGEDTYFTVTADPTE